MLSNTKNRGRIFEFECSAALGRIGRLGQLGRATKGAAKGRLESLRNLERLGAQQRPPLNSLNPLNFSNSLSLALYIKRFSILPSTVGNNITTDST